MPKRPSPKTKAPSPKPSATPVAGPAELIIVTALSGSGKGTVLRALEDFGYYSVDNLPIDLIPKFAELTRASPNIRRAALVVDALIGQQEIVVKQYDGVQNGLTLFGGATILGDGAPALIIDVSSLL